MKIGISTFGGDGGKSGISQYIIQLIREFARQPDGCTFEVIGYGDERAVFVPECGGITHLPFGSNLRSPIRNVFWHQTSLPRYCRERAFDVLFLPAGNRRLPLYSPCPTVGTVHDFSSIHVPGKYDRARMLYITRVLPLLIRRLTRVLTVSESSKRDIVEYARRGRGQGHGDAAGGEPGRLFSARSRRRPRRWWPRVMRCGDRLSCTLRGSSIRARITRG